MRPDGTKMWSFLSSDEILGNTVQMEQAKLSHCLSLEVCFWAEDGSAHSCRL